MKKNYGEFRDYKKWIYLLYWIYPTECKTCTYDKRWQLTFLHSTNAKNQTLKKVQTNEYKGTDISAYRPPNRVIHHCDPINIRILFALCELFSFSFQMCFCFTVFFSFQFAYRNKNTDRLFEPFFAVMLLRWNLHFCCCCSLQSDSTPREIQTQEFKRKQLMNEHDLNMQMQLKFRSFPPNVVFNLLFIFALDGLHTHSNEKPCLSPFQVACSVSYFCVWQWSRFKAMYTLRTIQITSTIGKERRIKNY